MRRKKKERKGWRKKKRKPALPNAIPGFVAGPMDADVAIAGGRRRSSNQDPRWRRSCRTNTKGGAALLKKGAPGPKAAERRGMRAAKVADQEGTYLAGDG
jgi:hypothetical protein